LRFRLPPPHLKQTLKKVETVETKVTKLRKQKLKEKIIKYSNVFQKCLYLKDMHTHLVWDIQSKNQPAITALGDSW
jgi:dynactin complex subunit